jgi:NADH-quinone oxidoreductase subunit N
MTSGNLLTLLPHVVVAVTIVITMLMIAFHRNHKLTVGLTLSGLVGGIAVIVASFDRGVDQATPLVVMDAYARFYIGLLLAAGIVITSLSYGYMAERSILREEYYVVLLVAIFGCMVLASSSHFVSMFLGLELLSVSLYVLIGYPRSQADRIEAGIKYFVPAAISVSFLLLGMALVYMMAGTMEFRGILHGLEARDSSGGLLFLAGVALMTVGLGFKLALVPFHLWAADVYQGAPTPVAALIATASKGAVFAVMMRFFTAIEMQEWKPVFPTFAAIAIATMFTGNLLALRQDNLKRLLGYSSIAHMGYVLVAFLAGGLLSVTAVTFYFLAYFTTVLGVFGILVVLSDPAEDFQRLESCRGLAFRRPYLAGILTVMLFSLAGIPLTAGFMGKFYVLGAGVSRQLHLLTIALVVNSAIGLFYYLRVVAALFADPSKEDPAVPLPRELHPVPPTCPRMARATLGVLTLLLFWIGAYPTTFAALVDRAASSLK